MSRTENMAVKQYMKARYGHKKRAEFLKIRQKMRKQLKEADPERRDKFVDDVRTLLTKSNVVVNF
jgi:hypothetical protein